MLVRKRNTIYILSNSYQYNYFLQTVFGYLSRWKSYESLRERERERERESGQIDRQTKNGGECVKGER